MSPRRYPVHLLMLNWAAMLWMTAWPLASTLPMEELNSDGGRCSPGAPPAWGPERCEASWVAITIRRLQQPKACRRDDEVNSDGDQY